MGYRAVALSQVDGSGAEFIGRDVAQQLGFGYLNEAIVAQAAKIRGVDPAMISDAEQRKSLLSRLAEMALRNAPDMSSPPKLYAFDETDMLLWDRHAAVGYPRRGAQRRRPRKRGPGRARGLLRVRRPFGRSPRLGHRSAVDEGVPAGFRARPQ